MATKFLLTAIIGLLIAATATAPGTSASAATLQGNCTCTDQPPFCDPDKEIFDDLAGVVSGPDKSLILAEDKYIVDEDGAVWHCEKAECTFTGIFVQARNEGVRSLTGLDNYMG